MKLVQRLKSVLGLDSATNRERDDDVAVTIERESTRSSTTDVDDDTASVSDEITDESTESEHTHQTGDQDSSSRNEPVDVIEGIGPAYSDRLSAVGIETVADLAAADPTTIATETDLSPARVERWIERASNRT